MPIATRRQRMVSSLPSTTRTFISSGDSHGDSKTRGKIESESNPRVPRTATRNRSKKIKTENNRELSQDLIEDDRLLLRSWINHSHADYHNFTEDRAAEIRSALLDWYSIHRRKLPWRGDPPPFDGSTSGINCNNKKRSRGNANTTAATVNTTKKTRKANHDDRQKSIKHFFAKIKREKTQSGLKEIENDTEPSKDSLLEVDPQAIPVTGYGVWVSEIMLQQTRVEAVIPFWINWMKSFPTVYDLAAATEDEVNAHWAGLGFYRRARYLHQGAKFVVQELNGELPRTPKELSKIIGIGPYTASAIASIAFGVCVPVVDGNVCRVLSRLTGIANHIKNPILKDKLGWKLATQIVEAGDGSSPGLVNQALMELGATYCAPAGSGVDPRDPLRDYYLSTRLGRAYLAAVQDGTINGYEFRSLSAPENHCVLCNIDGIQTILQKFKESITANGMTTEQAAMVGHAAFPADPPKKDKREEDLAVVVLFHHCETEGVNDCASIRYLMVKRPKEGLLAGQWEFPNVCIQTRKRDKKKNGITKNEPTTKIPKRAEREQALTKFLVDDLLLDYPNDEVATAVSNVSRIDFVANKQPMEHIFSHVKHYMWVEVGQLTEVCLEECDLEWRSPSGKDVRWMSKSDMAEVGITSGVKKVLQAVEKASRPDC